MTGDHSQNLRARAACHLLFVHIIHTVNARHHDATYWDHVTSRDDLRGLIESIYSEGRLPL